MCVLEKYFKMFQFHRKGNNKSLVIHVFVGHFLLYENVFGVYGCLLVYSLRLFLV